MNFTDKYLSNKTATASAQADEGRQDKKSSFTRFHLNKGIELVQAEFEGKKSSRLLMEFDKYMFFFNLGDRIELFPSKGNVANLSRYQAFLNFNEEETSVEIKANQGKQYKFCVFLVDSEAMESYTANKPETKSFQLLNNKNRSYKLELPLEVLDHLYILMKTEKTFPYSIVALGHLAIALGRIFKSIHSGDADTFSRSSLRKWEIEEIEKVIEKIRKNPEENYLVPELANECGISISRLQTGFKEMHGTTVANFIRDIRLEKAVELIQTTDMNISEVVYSVGFCSRSYFSRIFRLKNKCTPTEYQQRINSLVVTG